jgi:hypothetical protein
MRRVDGEAKGDDASCSMDDMMRATFTLFWGIVATGGTLATALTGC